MNSAYKLFKQNLGKAEMLIYVHTFNLVDWALQLDFVLGQKDLEQWMVRIGCIKRIFKLEHARTAFILS